MLDILEEFKHYRERMNARILTSGGLGIKRFFALDSRVYEKGALDVRTKELMVWLLLVCCAAMIASLIMLSVVCRRVFLTPSFLKL